MIAPFDMFVSRKWTDLQLDSHSSTCKTYEKGTRKAMFRSVIVYNKNIQSMKFDPSNKTKAE
jgi:hypothetical protein